MVKKNLTAGLQELGELYEVVYQKARLGRVQIRGERVLLNGLEVGEELLTSGWSSA
jgi:hypothetical protein